MKKTTSLLTVFSAFLMAASAHAEDSTISQCPLQMEGHYRHEEGGKIKRTAITSQILDGTKMFQVTEDDGDVTSFLVDRSVQFFGFTMAARCESRKLLASMEKTAVVDFSKSSYVYSEMRENTEEFLAFIEAMKQQKAVVTQTTVHRLKLEFNGARLVSKDEVNLTFKLKSGAVRYFNSPEAVNVIYNKVSGFTQLKK